MGVAGTGVDTPVHLLLDSETSLVSTCSLGLFTHLVSESRGSRPRAGKDIKKKIKCDILVYGSLFSFSFNI